MVGTNPTLPLDSTFELILADFLMKYIIIGTYGLFNISRSSSLNIGSRRRSWNREIVSIASLYPQFMFVKCEIRRHFVHYSNTDKDHSQHTIGVEFSSRTVKLGEKRIKLQVKWIIMCFLVFVLNIELVMGHSRPGAVSVCSNLC